MYMIEYVFDLAQSFLLLLLLLLLNIIINILTFHS